MFVVYSLHLLFQINSVIFFLCGFRQLSAICCLLISLLCICYTVQLIARTSFTLTIYTTTVILLWKFQRIAKDWKGCRGRGEGQATGQSRYNIQFIIVPPPSEYTFNIRLPSNTSTVLQLFLLTLGEQPNKLIELSGLSTNLSKISKCVLIF